MSVSPAAFSDSARNRIINPSSLHTALQEKRPIQELSQLINPRMINQLVNGKTALYCAVETGYIPAITLLLEKGADPFIADEATGKTCFHIAAYAPIEVLSSLKSAHIPHGQLELQDKVGRTALYLAAQCGYFNRAQMLLELGAKPDTRCGQYEWTALHIAAKNGHANCIDLFKDMPEVIEAEAKTENGATPLYLACREGKHDAAKALLTIGAKADTRCGPHKETALHMAALKGHTICIELFRDMPEVIEAQTKDGFTALYGACQNGKHDAAKALLAMGARPQSNEITALHAAAAQGHVKCIELFRGMPEVIEAKSKGGRTALYMACEQGKHDTAIALLAIGARPNASSGLDEQTALHIAARKGHINCIELFKGMPEVIEAKTKGGLTALYAACQAGKHDAAIALLALGAKTDTRCGPYEQTALYAAAALGHVKCIELFRDTPEVIDAKTKGGRTALSGACQEGKHDSAKALLAIGAKADTRCGQDKLTALHTAVFRGHVNCIELFRDMPEVIEAKSNDGRTALFFACQEGKHDAAIALLAIGAKADTRCGPEELTALHIAAAQGHAKCIELFRDMPEVIDAKAINGATALYIACQLGNLDAAKALLAMGARPDSRCGHSEWTALHIAAKKGHVNCIELFKGMTEIIEQQESGVTALHYACHVGNHNAAKALLAIGAKADTRGGPNELTALHIAAARGHANCVELFRDMPEVIEAKSIEGDTPLMYACQKENIDAAKALLNMGASLNELNLFKLSKKVIAEIRAFTGANNPEAASHTTQVAPPSAAQKCSLMMSLQELMDPLRVTGDEDESLIYVTFKRRVQLRELKMQLPGPCTVQLFTDKVSFGFNDVSTTRPTSSCKVESQGELTWEVSRPAYSFYLHVSSAVKKESLNLKLLGKAIGGPGSGSYS